MKKQHLFNFWGGITLFLFLMSFAKLSAQNANEAILYDGTNFTGSSITLGVGIYPDLASSHNFANKASSIKGGKDISLYLHSCVNFGPQTNAYTGFFPGVGPVAFEDADLSDNSWNTIVFPPGPGCNNTSVVNNDVNSVIVMASNCTPGANQIALFDGTDYIRGCVLVGIGEYENMTTGVGFLNDLASSIKVGSNVKVELFRDFGFTGPSAIFNQSSNTSSLSGSIGNNVLSSFKVMDAAPPTALCKNKTVKLLNGATSVSIVPEDIDNGSSDNTGTPVTLELSKTSFSCSDIPTTTVTLTVTDQNNFSATCTATVTVKDKSKPSINCGQVILKLDANGQASITGNQGLQSYSDNCTLTSELNIQIFGQSTFDCDDLKKSIILRGYQVTDAAGNDANCSALIRLKDDTPPTQVTCKSTTVYLDENGQGTLAPADVFQSANDNCGGTISPVSVSPSNFTCVDLGQKTVTLSVEDESENVSTCTAVVSVEDKIKPSITCKNPTLVLGEDGTLNIKMEDILDSENSSDNCGPISLNLMLPNTVDCSDLGEQNILLGVWDPSKNTSVCQVTATIVDNTPPNLVCFPTTVFLNEEGKSTLSISNIPFFADDNCAMAPQEEFILEKTEFFCQDIGAQSIHFTVFDESMNSKSCTITVTVLDKIPPTVNCKTATVTLDASGNGTLQPEAVFLSANDNCESDITLVNVLPNTFLCSNLGINLVTLQVKDAYDNTQTCSVNVNVVETTSPSVVCKAANVSISPAGTALVTPAMVFQSGSDNCGTVNPQSVTPNSIDCNNLGANTVVLLVNDGNGNTNTCTAIVTVTDNTKPQAKCKTGTTNVFLDANGQLTLQPSAVNNNSSDNCSIQSLTVAPNQFSCSDLGLKTVTLTATDPSNNSSACTAQIRVRDNTKPTAVCQNVTTAIGSNGLAYITPYQVNNGSTDNCTINGLTLSKSQFSCANIGNNTVTLRVKDQSLNVGTCTATITVIDNGGIQAKCKEVFLNLNSSGQGSITAAQVNNNSTDNCSGITNMMVAPSQFTCSNIGANVVVLSVQDNNGNSATCWTQVYVGDQLAPNAVCQPATISLNQNGQATLQPSQVNNGSTDNCTIASMSVNPNQFNAPGQQTVTLTVTDGFGYTAACTATVTIQPYSLPREAAANPMAAAFDLRLAPNPAADATSLLFFLEQEGPVRVRLFNSEGREVMTKEYAGIAGENVIALPLGQWPAGVYYVQFSAQGGVTSRSLMIQRN